MAAVQAFVVIHAIMLLQEYNMKKYGNLIFLGAPIFLMVYGYIPTILRKYFSSQMLFQIFIGSYIALPVIFFIYIFLKKKGKNKM